MMHDQGLYTGLTEKEIVTQQRRDWWWGCGTVAALCAATILAGLGAATLIHLCMTFLWRMLG
jgi:hypothetical protein